MIENAAHLAMLACLAGVGLLVWFLTRPTPPWEGHDHLDEGEAIRPRLKLLEEIQRAQAPHPKLRSYEGAARLQRAQKVATEFLMQKGGGRIEATGRENNGYREYGIRPLTPIRADDLARAIITAWLGDEEPMVNVPIMKLGDIKVERNEQAWADAQKRLDAQIVREMVRSERQEGRATGGFVKKGKPYIVGEQPAEKPRPTWPAPTPLHPRQDDGK